jgi:hypothetical protein
MPGGPFGRPQSIQPEQIFGLGQAASIVRTASLCVLRIRNRNLTSIVWLSFFLKYYRDGMAEVDHMDVEANDTRNSESVIDLVVKVAHARPPISEDQLRWRLRM